ncbi:MAG: hypothetical protein ACKVQQ_21285 [Burkholderiales bacterium]
MNPRAAFADFLNAADNSSIRRKPNASKPFRPIATPKLWRQRAKLWRHACRPKTKLGVSNSMRIDWFLPSKLANRLARDDVSNREVAYLTLANLLFSSVIFYGAFTWSNLPWTVLSLLEFVTVVVVTTTGFVKCYDAAGGDGNNSFVKHYTCLSFGIGVWTTAFTWTTYWVVAKSFRYGVITFYNVDQTGIAKNLAMIGGSFEWLWTFIATVMWQVVYFFWMQRCLAKVAPA